MLHLRALLLFRGPLVFRGSDSIPLVVVLLPAIVWRCIVSCEAIILMFY